MDNINPQNSNPNQNQNKPGAPFDIRVMPEKFYIQKPPKSKKGLLILIIIILLLGIGGGLYFLSLQLKPAPVVNKNVANTNVANENTNEVKLNVNEVQLNVNENTNEIKLNINENTNANVNAVNANTNTVPELGGEGEVGLKLESTTDSDKDGLTDTEEALYQTEPNVPDTDGDGYLDGQEVESDYNPKAANSKLADSGLVNTYINNIFKYTILYPASWLAKPTDASLQSVVFQSATGEYIQVLVQDNPNRLSLLEWFMAQSPTSNPNNLKPVTTLQGLAGITSEDGLTDYLAPADDNSKIYIVTYNIGNNTRLNFLTTFKMMINSLALVK